ncbi:MAG: bacillithiol biosynthesis deacetylase BshB1 [Planctomycetes bacterium]|nr:bacillithiol biosynthesis deacetylase BshB1 [Planctomycetota bacterium]
MKLDLLVIAAHPDDAEICVGGTLLKLASAGRKIGIVDVTRGEMGTRGSRADRDRETARANELLGLSVRENLELPDGRVQVTLEAREHLARILREHRPELVLAQHTEDLHPDHFTTGRLAREAWYLAGLQRLAELDGGPTAARPKRLLHFAGHLPFEPSFVVDIGPVWERKLELVRSYQSQLAPADAGDRGQHFLFGADILSRMETRARFFGERVGVRYGEPLLHVGPLLLGDVAMLA